MTNKDLLLKQYNEVAIEKVETYNECLKALNQLFKEKYEIHEDAQMAYDELAQVFPFITTQLCYQITGWEIIIDDYSFEEEVIENFNLYYDADCSSLDDVVAELQKHIYDAMNNAGCDHETAFNSISEDVCLDGITYKYDDYSLCEI